MTNELKWVAGTEKTLQNANGSSTADSVYTQASTGSLTASDTAGYEALSFESVFTYGSAPTAGTVVDIYARPLNFESTNDAEAPSANFQNEWIGAIPLNNVTSTQYFKTRPWTNPYPLTDVDIYICNRAGQTLSANWTLKVTPVTRAPT